MRKICILLFVALAATPAFAEDFSVEPVDPMVLAQLQGPYVVPAPRYITHPNGDKPVRNQRRQRTQQFDAELEQPEPQPRQQRQAQRQRDREERYYEAQQPRGNLGGGFIEFLVTGNSGQRYQQHPQPRREQNYYYAPRTDYVQQQREQEPLYVTRTDPLAQPPRSPVFDPRYERKEVEYKTAHPAGTIIIDTKTRYLYYVLGNGRAVRYGVGVGRPGFEWAGVKTVTAMKEWPDWRPPKEMRQRQPHLPEFMPGGPKNPLGARALYLGSSLYRIHGSNEPHTIGSAVSSGCIRMRNQDVIDLYERVKVGTKVFVI
ncbi:MAG TPA: L,D-transpeptidase [Xanthobacteraceae bacterium]|nr:L,D-transpeptidase [Xanthobacteraceae bacterium]